MASLEVLLGLWLLLTFPHEMHILTECDSPTTLLLLCFSSYVRYPVKALLNVDICLYPIYCSCRIEIYVKILSLHFLKQISRFYYAVE